MSKTDETNERYRAPALDKGLDIIELLSGVEESMSQSEIAKALDRSSNEIYRMLDRLVRRGYVARTSADRYEMTLKLFGLAHRHPPMRRLVSQSLPVMRCFAREAEQSCHMTVYDRGSLVVIAQVDAPGYWGIAIRVGSHISLLNTGSGHLLLAFAPPAERALMLEEREVMPHEIRVADFDERLNRVRAQGYEMMPSQQTAGITNISMPLMGPSGRVLAALTCAHLPRLDVDNPRSTDEVRERLEAAAREITAAAGGDWPDGPEGGRE
ncbi:IclR family transcriptional regulator [Aureimonas psammosilenae]|uniref:IclR family transcriptional regulator n=1 Tax=Aureimonas psammosilenae TaxID=2495496 RepID=UPI0012606F22|nr:IclR family transcriptional regulator [Aureimonas psammosilenae]